MRIRAVERQHLQLRQTCEQLGTYRRALTQQNNRLGIAQACGQHLGILAVFAPDRDCMRGELRITIECPHGIEFIIQYGNVQGVSCHRSV